MSLIHVLPVVVASVRESYVIASEHDDIISAIERPNSELFQYTSALLGGYMIYDIIEIARNEQIYDPLFFIHHPVSFIGAYVGMTGIYETLILPYYLGEIPVIFINLFTVIAYTCPKIDVTLLQLSAALNFILFRLSWTFVLPYMLLTGCENVSECVKYPGSFAALTLVFFTLSVLNYYWFSKQVYVFLQMRKETTRKKSYKMN